jgi:hypothetical protein
MIVRFAGATLSACVMRAAAHPEGATEIMIVHTYDAAGKAGCVKPNYTGTGVGSLRTSMEIFRSTRRGFSPDFPTTFARLLQDKLSGAGNPTPTVSVAHFSGRPGRL